MTELLALYKDQNENFIEEEKKEMIPVKFEENIKMEDEGMIKEEKIENPAFT